MIIYPATSQAAVPPYVAMELCYLPATSPLVEAVNVLGNKEEFVELILQIPEGIVGWIRLDILDKPPPVFIPLPDQLGIPHKSIHRGQLLGVELPPEAILTPKSGNSAFGGNPCPGEHCQGTGRAQPVEKLIREGLVIPHLTGKITTSPTKVKPFLERLRRA